MNTSDPEQLETWLANAASAVPSPAALTLALAGLARFETLSTDAQLDLLTVVNRLQSMTVALAARALTYFVEQDDTPYQISREQAAAVLRVPPRGMGQRIADARTLVRDLPRTSEALQAGLIGAAHVRRIVEGFDRLAAAAAEGGSAVDVETRASYEATVLERVDEHTPARLGRVVERAVLRLDPLGADRRATVAARGRRIELQVLEDHLMQLRWTAPAADVVEVYRRIQGAVAQLGPSDERCVEQQRSDLLRDAVLRGIPIAALPERRRRRAQLNVHVALPTLLGLDQHPGWLDGYGPVPLTLVRELVHTEDTTWRRVVTGDDGTAVQLSRRYRPSEPVRQLVLHNEPSCVFPGCGHPSHDSELDHVQPFGRGGLTTADNLSPTCKRHHQGKTKGHFRHTRAADAVHTWSLGTRHRFTARPERRLCSPPGEQQDRTGRPSSAPDDSGSRRPVPDLASGPVGNREAPDP
ncbi:HNH endonuclease [Jatrophihabitans telluris]|uniref:HNH endonuclease n=1 Tax=Jatrophihabitans telluris TaxID=2038343 RepID=A0ABY4QXY2_9ACTN|nr:HNH endonuclease signature motif containing protein [Jatrophihabitans telluris]UQX88244.1 HNH endonuclease [Jatrophihabitans telluris]